MKYVLIKYKNIKLLINEGCQSEPLLVHLAEIESFAKKVSQFYANLLTASKGDVDEIEAEKRSLLSKIGYKIIGVPFTSQDAEMYALNEGLEYSELELHGSVGSKHATKPEKEFEQINVMVETPLKTMAVRHVNRSHHKNLTQYIEYLIKKDLGL